MTNARTFSMPLDHLVAEMTAFPFASTISLVRPVDSLEPKLDPATRNLWRSAERYFVARFPHVGLDELIAVRNRTWFESLGDSIPIHAYLRLCAKSWLRQRGSVAIPKLPDGSSKVDNADAAARRAWRWLTFAMPADLLIAGLGGQLGGQLGGPVKCEIVTPFVSRLLQEKGYAETHLHLGAGLSFSSAWASAVNVVGRTNNGRNAVSMNVNAFSSPGAEHDEGDDIGRWLVRAAIARYILAGFLAWKSNYSSIDQFLNDPHLWSETELTATQMDVLSAALYDLADGRLSNVVDPDGNTGVEQSFVMFQESYNALTGVSSVPLPDRLHAVQTLDPLYTFYRAATFSGPSCQLQFLWAGLNYLENHPTDKSFARLFWQAERVRCQVYRHCVQRPMTPGLMNFVRVYERKRAIISALSSVELESCGELGGIGKGLKSLEVRTRPSSRKNDQLSEITEWTEQLTRLRQRSHDDPEEQGNFVFDHGEAGSKVEAWRNLECGVVLHFLKSRGVRNDLGEPLADDADNFADPRLSDNTLDYRWQDFLQRSQVRADALIQTIRQEPTILHLVRGIDVCRDEHGVPTWVIAPLFHQVRNAVEEIRAAQFVETGIDIPPLLTTTHVGEDFVHLATGIRYMDEAIEFLPFSAGDRVGHGLALGIDSQRWAKREHCQLMPQEDRWFDLIWERLWHGKMGADFPSNRKTYVEDEIVRLANEIFGDEFAWSPTVAIRFWKALYNGELLRMGFPGQPLDELQLQTPLRRQLHRYLTSPTVYKNCRKVIWIDASKDGAAAAELQRCVRSRYAERGITIEVNPISNLMVGDLADLTSHPLWRLAPGLDHDFGEPLRMCVGSDDPLPFSTTLPEEYQFLYDALLLAGRSHASAFQWLDQIREMGLHSRFTLPDTISV